MSTPAIPGGIGQMYASAFINGSAGAGAVGSKFSGGVESLVRTGAGVYVLTLDQPTLAADYEFTVTIIGAPAEWGVVHTSNTVKTISVIDNAAAATDRDVRITMTRAF